MSLVQQLVKKKIIDKNRATALEYEIKSSGQKEEEIILEKKIVSEDFLFGLKGEQLKIPLKVVVPDEVPLNVLESMPEESAKYYRMIPLFKKDNYLEIGMVYPDDLKAREALEFLSHQSNFNYSILLITPTNFGELLKKYRSLKKEVSLALEELKTELATEEIKAVPTKGRMAEFERMVEEAPISKVVAVILRHAVDGNASDIHIEPTRERLQVRFRLDGILHPSLFLPLRVHQAVVARIKIISNLKIDETRVPQDGRFSAAVTGRNIDFRVSTFPTTLGEKVVMRVLDPGQRKVSFEELGITGRNLKAIENALEKSYGMILSTGPTGSGKTTTLYSILGLFNKEEENIMTLEDPVEYFIEGVNQSQVKPEIGYTFASGLRYMLRQDPDIIMVGEIRDEETASLSIHAALTGHILLSSLHTSNALGVVPRLIDMGVQPFLIPPTLSLAIAQRLARKLCPHCKKRQKANQEVKSLILKEIDNFPAVIKKTIKLDKTLYVCEPVGCKKCNNIGYSGRIGFFEILEMTPQLSELILTRPSEGEILKEAQRQGMVTMKQDGILKVLEGATSLEEVLRVAEEK
ncbi:MAG: type II/IV secretion system protein [Candidatus Nealsonbacteria bacterium]|nr:type II/IV secretion system protein [Candidatus Nealsonbacteria bacterium]